eukprot:8279332-Heterocapsa_arctica.AAC.1
MEDDGRTLASYNIQAGATIKLAVCGRGGGPSNKGPTNKELAEAIIAEGQTNLTLSKLMRLRKDVLISMMMAPPPPPESFKKKPSG